MPAGRHRIQAWPSGADEDTEPVVDEFITLEAGQQATAAIGLDGEGNADITLYDDEELLPEEGDTALVVRGLAEADAVRVPAGDRTVAPSLTSASQGLARVRPGSYAVSVQSADGGDTLVPSQEVPVAAGRAVVLYLVGSQDDDTLGWVAQTVRPNASAAPTRVDTGSGPLPADSRPRCCCSPCRPARSPLFAARRRARADHTRPRAGGSCSWRWRRFPAARPRPGGRAAATSVSATDPGRLPSARHRLPAGPPRDPRRPAQRATARPVRVQCRASRRPARWGAHVPTPSAAGWTCPRSADGGLVGQREQPGRCRLGGAVRHA